MIRSISGRSIGPIRLASASTRHNAAGWRHVGADPRVPPVAAAAHVRARSTRPRGCVQPSRTNPHFISDGRSDRAAIGSLVRSRIAGIRNGPTARRERLMIRRVKSLERLTPCAAIPAQHTSVIELAQPFGDRIVAFGQSVKSWGPQPPYQPAFDDSDAGLSFRLIPRVSRPCRE